MDTILRIRVRKILRLAAKQTSGGPKKWLLLDECGTWESQCVSMLAKTADRANVLGFTDAEVDDQIATMAALQATTAYLK